MMLLPGRLLSQEYSYTHYDIADGLAGSSVYCIAQDADGFIWLGTETGVSRFDGSHFRNFSTDDGLPDVEVLEMFGDSRGRVWMAPFQKSVCYYYKGQIHNQQNDQQLHRIPIRNNIYRFAADSAGDILAAALTELYLIKADGTGREIDSIAGVPIHDCGAVSTSADGHFLVQAGNEVYQFTGDRFTPVYPITAYSSFPAFVSMNAAGMIWWEQPSITGIHSFVTGNTIHLPFGNGKFEHNTFSSFGDSLFLFNENSGVREYNARTGSFRRLLPGKPVSRTFRDATGNLWFATMGQGIYRLNSDEFQTVRFGDPTSVHSAIYGIKRIGDQLLVGDDQNNIYFFRLTDHALLRSYHLSEALKVRIHDFGTRSDGTIYVTSTRGVQLLLPHPIPEHGYLYGVKSSFPMGHDKALVAAHWGTGILDLNTFRIDDTLYHDRTTAIYFRRDTSYIGTLNGLYGIAPNRSLYYYGDKIPFLRKRISELAESPDGTLWVGSYDAGVVGFRDGAVVAVLNRQQGLTSNICRTLFIHGNTLWIGTDKGLNRVRLDRPDLPVDHYNSQDGLASDLINCIFADGPVVYVGTSSGLSYFDETRINVREGCLLHLLSIQNSGLERIGDSTALALPYTDKHLRLEFAGISYRSVGDITYRYRLMGLDSAWRTTRESFLEYPTLPSGKYQLQLQATNKFGFKSEIVRLPFEVEAPWWQSTLFYILVVAAFLSLTWLLVSLRIRQIRNRQQEKEQLNQRMIQMEHMALQAQMNPHFIFNCLNSIQQYIFDKDIFAANKYITGFSKLIRATLQHSSQAFVPLQDEIDYLSHYLSLEKLRFKEKMDYSIDVSPDIDIRSVLIPPMLVQPYVENSMRHGLRHKTDGKGFIRISMTVSEGNLTIAIEDNGIGREKAARYKTTEHIEYQSKGMSLTAERIGLMNKLYGEGIKVEILDLRNKKETPEGTRVTMKFPLFVLTSKNDPYDQDYTG
jgi:streptogramin lyase